MKIKTLGAIFAGGVGRRLWPLSDDTIPKQFIVLAKDKYSSFQNTILSVIIVYIFCVGFHANFSSFWSGVLFIMGTTSNRSWYDLSDIVLMMLMLL